MTTALRSSGRPSANVSTRRAPSAILTLRITSCAIHCDDPRRCGRPPRRMRRHQASERSTAKPISCSSAWRPGRQSVPSARNGALRARTAGTPLRLTRELMLSRTAHPFPFAGTPAEEPQWNAGSAATTCRASIATPGLQGGGPGRRRGDGWCRGREVAVPSPPPPPAPGLIGEQVRRHLAETLVF
jgi:hypothetical protein